ncbi:MAG: pyruvate formate lyase family protein [Enterocloster sp.]
MKKYKQRIWFMVENNNKSVVVLFLQLIDYHVLRRQKMSQKAVLSHNTDNFAAAGAGTVIDSLYAIKKAVYEDKITTFGHLLKAMKEDFRDDEISF